jgi:hypothetical protein
MAGSIKVTVVSMEPGATTWASRVVTMTTAIVLPEEEDVDDEFGDEPTAEWTNHASRQEASTGAGASD